VTLLALGQRTNEVNLKAVAFLWNSDPHIPGIPAGDPAGSAPILIKTVLPFSLACGLSFPAFIGNDGRIELSYLINFFVGDTKGNGR